MKLFGMAALSAFVLIQASAYAGLSPKTKLVDLVGEKFSVVMTDTIENSHRNEDGALYHYVSIGKGESGFLGGATCRFQSSSTPKYGVSDVISTGTEFEVDPSQSAYNPNPNSMLFNDRIDFHFVDAVDANTGKTIQDLWIYCFDASYLTVGELEKLFGFFKITK